jgi:hypothetical protein
MNVLSLVQEKMQHIIWTNHVKNEEVLHGVYEEWNDVHWLQIRKGNWICHILRKNFLLKRVIEGNIEVIGRRERRCKQLLDDLGENKYTETWKTKRQLAPLGEPGFGRG